MKFSHVELSQGVQTPCGPVRRGALDMRHWDAEWSDRFCAVRAVHKDKKTAVLIFPGNLACAVEIDESPLVAPEAKPPVKPAAAYRKQQ